MRSAVGLLVVTVTLAPAPAQASPFLSFKDAKSYMRSAAKGFVVLYDADYYRISPCFRRASNKVECRVRLHGADSGSTNCDMYLKVVLHRRTYSRRLTHNFCS